MENRLKNIGIIGAGAWGTALSCILNKKENITIWSYEKKTVHQINKYRTNKTFLPNIKIPNNISATNNLKDLMSCKFIFICVPSQFIKKIILKFKNFYKKDMIFVNCSKGIEHSSKLLISDIIKKILPGSEVAILSGPSFAIEVAKKKPTAVTIGSKDEKNAKKLAKLVNSKTFRCYYSNDIVGVQLGGVIKNILAIASGIVESQNLGSSARAALITRGLAEVSRLAYALGARRETLSGLSGLGDLVLTCTGKLSRNRRVGFELGKGKPLDEIVTGMSMVAEGIRTTDAGLSLGACHGVELPITSQMSEVLAGRIEPRAAVEALMLRRQRIESEPD